MQPLKPHEHWHVDISYLNLGGMFYYLCSLLDGYSLYIARRAMSIVTYMIYSLPNS